VRGLKGVRKPVNRGTSRAAGQRHLHLLTETRVVETLLSRKVYLVNPVRGPSGSWLPACHRRREFEEAWWCEGAFAGAGEEWAVKQGFAEVIISRERRAGPGSVKGRDAVRRRQLLYGRSGRRQAELSAQRIVSQEESLRRSAAAEATNARLQAVPVLNAPLPSSWANPAGQPGSRSGRRVEGRDLGDSLVRNVASAEAKRGGKGVLAERAATAAVRTEEKLRRARAVQVRNARASLINARRLQEWAEVPPGASEFIAAGVLQAGNRATTAAKRKLTDALAGGTVQPQASSRGQRMAAIAIAAAESRSIL
jgi:hypothetical protein